LAEEISLDDILTIQEREIQKQKVERVFGVRDIGTLQYLIEFGLPKEATPWDQAALTLHTIAALHPFHDGNKRTAFIVAHLILQLSGWEVVVDNDEIAEFVLLVAVKRQSKMQIVKWMMDYAVPLSDLT
jgi:death-on-curing protein